MWVILPNLIAVDQTYDFPLLIHSNHRPTLYNLQDTARYWLKFFLLIFVKPCLFKAPHIHLPVNNFFSSTNNNFFAISILLQISYVHCPSSDITRPRKKCDDIFSHFDAIQKYSRRLVLTYIASCGKMVF